MRLRSQAKRQQQEQQLQQQHGIEDINGAVGQLPPEIMYMLASRLSAEDLASASLVCKSWSRWSRAGITRVTLFVGKYLADSPYPKGIMTGLAKHCSVSELQVLLNSRSDYFQTAKILSRIGDLPQLKHLELHFSLSNTPRKGSWPMFFAENLTAAGLESLVIEATGMPSIGLMSLLHVLSIAHKFRPITRSLDLRLGQLPAGSQLPVFQSPTWLLDNIGRITALDSDRLLQLARITALRSLRCELDNTVTDKAFDGLSKLTNLTELVLYGDALNIDRVKQLSALKGLRRLSFKLAAVLPSSLEDLDLDHVQELDLSVSCNPAGSALEPLLSRPPGGLRGLSISGLSVHPWTITRIAGLTNLTSLHLTDASMGTTIMDFTPLRQLSNLKRFELQMSQTVDLMQIRFAPLPPPPKPERILTGPCQSVGKRHKSSAAAQQQRQQQQRQQDPPEVTADWGDASALASAWPHLQQLRLSGLPPYAVSATSWEGLSSLTGLTSLALQFAPKGTNMLNLLEGCAWLKQPVFSAGGGLPLVHLEHLPASMQQLQLCHCYVGVPSSGCLRAGESLTSLSLSGCWLGSIQKGTDTAQGYPTIEQDTNRLPAAADGTPNPLVQLLQLTQGLRRLELISLPWLTDALLAATASQTQLRGLSSLSILGVGNQELTHGALLGLTGLCKLRELRWHVGDVLALMPDVKALEQLKGLMTLHIPNWLHSQMERWGAYAVLDSMPLCDVNVELPGV